MLHPDETEELRGTYAGLAHPAAVEHLQGLGVTAVELLPIDELEENDCPYVHPLKGERLKNFWGYNTIAFAAHKAAYSRKPTRSGPW